MPMQELGLPIGMTNLKLVRNGVNYPLLIGTHTFTRTGEDGAGDILPLCRGSEFVGEVLDGQWGKDWDADITAFTARCDSGQLELTGYAAGAGTPGAGWITGNQPIPMMKDTEVIVSMQSPIDDTGASADRDVAFGFFLLQDKDPSASPASDNNYLRIDYDIDETGLYFVLYRKIGGSSTVLFTGSTYTNGSGRATGDLEGTIWRFVFHDGVTGASSPSDVRHMHVYLKQSDTIANAESATEYELSNGPYDISGLEFNVAYPAYRIMTENTTYFGVVIGSANGVSSTYLRVNHEPFTIQYDIPDANWGLGDVELWDGDPDSDGIQVFDEDHNFTSDIYLQNGLIRLHVDELAAYGVNVLYYSGAAWVKPLDQLYYYLVAATKAVTVSTFRNTILVSPEKTVIKVRFIDTTNEDSDYFVDTEVTLKRGGCVLEFNPVGMYPFDQLRFLYLNSPRLRFGYVGDDDIADDDLNITGLNTTMTDNVGVLFDDAGLTMLATCFSNQKPDGTLKRYVVEDGGDFKLQDYLPINLGTLKTYVGLKLFSDIANLFEEAEDADLQAGATAEVDATASNGEVAFLNAQNEQVLHYITDELPVGRYKAYIRVKDANQVASDVWLRVYNATDAYFMDEPHAGIIFTATAAWAYKGVVFDVKATDSGDTCWVGVRKETATANEVSVDYFLIVPVGDGESFPQDLAHASMRESTKPKRLLIR